MTEDGRAERVATVLDHLRRLERVVVAFSGGADSAFVLAAAVRALGADRVTAATAVSPSLPAAELERARAFAAQRDVEHLTPSTYEMDREGYRANGADRCYFCKAELLDVLTPLAEQRQATVVTGTNADDAVAGFRPGIRAAAERGAQAPLRDAGLTKQQVRDTSREWGLATWDKPAAACLSSRIAYGLAITPARLARVERAERRVRARLRAAGHRVRDLRVRDLGDGACRVELDPELVGAVDRGWLPEFERTDVRAFRSGSMNDQLRGIAVGRFTETG